MTGLLDPKKNIIQMFSLKTVGLPDFADQLFLNLESPLLHLEHPLSHLEHLKIYPFSEKKKKIQGIFSSNKDHFMSKLL